MQADGAGSLSSGDRYQRAINRHDRPLPVGHDRPISKVRFGQFRR
jgi:hypothetical protein